MWDYNVEITIYLVQEYESQRSQSYLSYKQSIMHYIDKLQYSIEPCLTLIICLKWLLMAYTNFLLNSCL